MTGYVGATTLDPSEQRVLKKRFAVVELAAKVEQALFPAMRPRQEKTTLSRSNRGSAIIELSLL